jgi:hypothetical protein
MMCCYFEAPGLRFWCAKFEGMELTEQNGRLYLLGCEKTITFLIPTIQGLGVKQHVPWASNEIRRFSEDLKAMRLLSKECIRMFFWLMTKLNPKGVCC